jgi:hypothetical protein
MSVLAMRDCEPVSDQFRAKREADWASRVLVTYTTRRTDQH